MIGAFKTYAELLVALSDDSFSDGFASEVEAVGKNLVDLQTTAVPRFPAVDAIDFKPLAMAAAAIGRVLIDVKTAQAISDVAPEVHPHLETMVDLLKGDLDSTDEIAIEQVSKITNNLQTVLVNDAAADRAPAGRFEAFRRYFDLNSEYSDRAQRSGALKKSLDGMV